VSLASSTGNRSRRRKIIPSPAFANRIIWQTIQNDRAGTIASVDGCRKMTVQSKRSAVMSSYKIVPLALISAVFLATAALAQGGGGGGGAGGGGGGGGGGAAAGSSAGGTVGGTNSAAPGRSGTSSTNGTNSNTSGMGNSSSGSSSNPPATNPNSFDNRSRTKGAR